MKGLEPLVETESKITVGFLSELQAQTQGKTTNFDSDRNLRVLKSIPTLIAQHTGVPIGLLTLQEVDDERIKANDVFEREICQSIRDMLRSEITKKMIEPETTRKGFTETASLGWKRKNNYHHSKKQIP